ncbi:hypothetical protein RJT34_29862 [Clitoria ternatea]|uniref:Uncharacterized protein n=1 Tax=Clitoria ternatea TaxID=43366 RepID=A0AAN9ES17_CLITE
MVQHGKFYKDPYEKKLRYQIFKENVKHIEAFNKAENKPYKLGINQFGDLTNEEFKSRNKFKGHMCFTITRTPTFKYEHVSAVPVSLTEGSCHTHQEPRPMWYVLAFDDYLNFSSVDGTCYANAEANHAASINGYEDVPANSESALLKAVANQPVYVAIDASGFEFQFYSSGVFTGSCGTSLDHGVTAWGYGVSDDGTKYWLVKNSWGTEWGEQGYIRMQRGVAAKEGLCGIAMQASYPTA